MHPDAELVRRVLRWAQQIILLEEAQGVVAPAPARPRCVLGRLMHRADFETATQIAKDMDEFRDLVGRSEKKQESHLAALVAEISRVEPRPLKPMSLNRRRGYELATRVIARERSLFHDEKRRLLEQGSLIRTWKALEEHWPRRVWSSLRDDFEHLALRFFNMEKLFLYEVADFIVQTRYDESRVARRSNVQARRQTPKHL